MDNSRRLKYPQLSERSRKLLETPEPGFAKRHPLLSTAIFTGALVISGLFVSTYAKPSEEKADSDSARVSVAAKESAKKDRLSQLKNIFKMRKALEGRISWGGSGEESVLDDEGFREEYRLKLLAMNNDGLQEHRMDIVDELEDIAERGREIGDRWPNYTDAEAEELESLEGRRKELEERKRMAVNEDIGRGTELILANEVGWKSHGELLNLRGEYIGMQLNGWNGNALRGGDNEYVERMLIVLNMAIDARRNGGELLLADLALSRPKFVN